MLSPQRPVCGIQIKKGEIHLFNIFRGENPLTKFAISFLKPSSYSAFLDFALQYNIPKLTGNTD